ncbi:uncharacterized protein N7479_007279 [Penicillium vulpinum]|uniref:uncharacterized protein n=1 Tax=Penicillium vulpinum TaxID=29845 RepID=UPI00254785D7|nr:uncharacterized protein N7479_007279 [Penicillium vulpinum]KAJ5960129.1 hypothetical protein N7479_007279 [Penicillium vulpinum]
MKRSNYHPAMPGFEADSENHGIVYTPPVHAMKSVGKAIVKLIIARGEFESDWIYSNKKTYNSEDSLVVTHPTTNSPACGLSTAERTGSPVFHTLWSYVSGMA